MLTPIALFVADDEEEVAYGGLLSVPVPRYEGLADDREADDRDENETADIGGECGGRGIDAGSTLAIPFKDGLPLDERGRGEVDGVFVVGCAL